MCVTRGDKPGRLDAETGAGIASSGPCGRRDNAMCDTKTAVPVKGGGDCVLC